MNTFVRYYCNRHAQHAYFYVKNWLSEHKSHQTGVIVSFFFMLSLLIASAFVLFTSHDGLTQGDYIFHNTRMTEILCDAIHGQLPLINQYIGSPKGIATGIFYPWLTMLPVILLKDFIEPIGVFYVIVIAIYFTGYLVAYFSYQTYDKSKWRSFVFSLIYATSISCMHSMFYYGDISNSLAIMLFPIAIFGTIALIKYGHWRMLTCGVVLIGYTHLISFALISGLIAILIISFVKELNTHKVIRLLLATVVSCLALVPMLVPILVLSSKNAISYPQAKALVPFARGMLAYGYGNPLALVLPLLALSCTAWSHKRYSRLDIVMIGILIFSIAINMSFVGNALVKVFPFLQALQFSYRLSVFGIFATAWLLMRYFRCHFRPINHFMLMNKFLVFLLIIVMPIGVITQNAYGYHSTPRFTNYRQRESIVRGHQVATSNRMYSELLQMPMFLDYTPTRSNRWDGSYASHVLYTEHSNRPEILAGSFRMTNPNVVTNTPHAEHNVVLPIVLYHGIRYQFTMNGRQISRKQINWKLTWRYQKLCLKRLSAGRNRIKIQSARLNI